MKKELLNGILLGLCALLLFGTLSVWRGEIRDVLSVRDDTGVAERSFDNFEQERVDKDFEREAASDVNATTTDEEVAAKEDEPTEPKPLPAEINLAVPFTSQAPEKNWDQPWQDACEEAAVLMVDAYYKGYGISPLSARDEIIKMVEWEEHVDRGWGGSIRIEQIEQLAEEFVQVGRSFAVIENPTVEQLKGYLAAGHPVLVVADGKELPNPHFQNDGPEYHALVIKGYTADSFITNDPGTQHGADFLYTYDDLMNAIRDWNDGDVKNGRRVVLVAQ